MPPPTSDYVRDSYFHQKLKQVNGIIRFVEDPCSAPWSVYARCLWPAVGHLALALLMFGFDDVVRGYFRPHGIYSHKRTGRRRARSRMSRAARAGIPEIGEMIGHNLPGASVIKGRGVSTKVAMLWAFDGVLQRIMFWWMILDVTTEFGFEWTTCIAESRECQLDRLVGSVLCKVQPSGYVHDMSGPLACSAIEKHWGQIGADGGAFQYYQPLGIMAASITAVQWVDEPWRVLTGITIWIADPANYLVPLSQPVEAEQQLDGSWNAVVDLDVFGPAITRAYIWPHGRNIFVIDGFLSGWAYKK